MRTYGRVTNKTGQIISTNFPQNTLELARAGATLESGEMSTLYPIDMSGAAYLLNTGARMNITKGADGDDILICEIEITSAYN